MNFHFKIDAQEVASRLGVETDHARELLKQEMKSLAVRTHAFIVEKARRELKGFFYEYYLGRRSSSGNLGENLKLHHISDTLHVIELDQKAAWIEDGRPATFIGDWVLNSPKAKTAKDGSRYISIPMTISKLAGPGKKPSIPALDTLARAALKNSRPRIPLKKIQYGADGKAVQGKIRSLDIHEPNKSQVAGFHSRPRSQEMAAMTGLPAHEGIFYGKGAHLRQKTVGKTGKGKEKVAREIGTFRTLSSKHKAEGRWMYPEVKAFRGFDAAYEWAQKQLDVAIADMARVLGAGGS